VTHNSRSAAHSIETVLSEKKFNIQKALILVKNTQLIKQFKKEIIYTRTNNEYKIDQEGVSTTVMWSEAKPFYNLYTYQTFFNEFKGHPDRLVSEYSNSVIVIDEVHDILHSVMYPFFETFLHIVRNRKIIVMTGTPMVNNASDIALLMNLILPRELQFPVEAAFNEMYINPNTGRIDDPEAIQQIQSRIKGRVSYLTSQVPIRSTFRGQKIGDISYPIVTHTMSDFQERSYAQALKLDGSDSTSSGFYIHSLDASLFVFPDGSYGTEGFRSHVMKKRDSYYAPFLNEMKRMSKQEKLRVLSRYSSKYSSIVQNVLNYPDENTFIYIKSITGSGAIMLGLVLEEFGFSRVTGQEKQLNKRAKRYAILSGETGTQWESIRPLFNQKRNSKGEYIQVLIGGEQVKQGVSFWSIQNIHIATPEWNFSNIDQAIARGIRIGSHRFLPENSNVNIFLHASIPVAPDIISIDMYVYQIAQEKDKAIKSIEYILKVSAVDCALTYERNRICNKEDDNTRKCEYRDCLYYCEGVSYPYASVQPLLDTYVLFFKDEYLEQLVQILQRVFLITPFFILDELIQALNNNNNNNNSEWSEFQIMQALVFIMEHKIPFTDKYGFPAYLCEQSNIYFLTHLLSQLPLATDSFYVQNPPLQKIEPTGNETQENKVVEADLDDIEGTPDIELKQALITTLPFWVQELFIEYAVLASHKQIETPMITWILSHYASFLNSPSSGTVLSTFMPDIVRKYSQNKWKTEDKETRAIHELSTEEFQSILRQGKGWLGTYKGKNNDFSIIDARDVTDIADLKKRRGQHCSTQEQSALESLVKTLDIDPPDTFTRAEAIQKLRRKGITVQAGEDVRKLGWLQSGKKQLCKSIEQWFVDRQLIIEL
jgi:hypothetical protein